jgi:translation initiation factor eIF-2B subunit alpha/methylthioribose-1-phosphate isomerase
MKINGKDYRSVWMEDEKVIMVDQPRIPHEFALFECENYGDTAQAIKDMVIRGAPAIGAAACYGMAQGALSRELEIAEDVLSKSRPTAYDLFDAIKYFKKNYKEGSDPVKVADTYADESAERCRKIGEVGDELIKDGMKILTHCNAGALACVDYGTALAPMRVAHEKGKNIFVWVDETRPRLQGARLTAWEMVQEGIDHALIADNSAGHYMLRGEVDICIVGTDRVAKNGDIANKIGTYEKAVVAKENNIPFYIAAPFSTIDFSCPTGMDIPIEERGNEEVNSVKGWNGHKMEKVRIAPEKASVKNPAFDVTPAKYVTGIITERGVFKPEEISSLDPDNQS